MTDIKYLKDIITNLPHKPGVYQYFDNEENIIYIGKAKDLKNRVSSYFNNDKTLSGKTRLLVSKISNIKFILVETEMQALLLENNLIKEYKPRYNILLKDDKSYPFIVIKNEPFPRIITSRQFIKDGSIYFGPYTSVNMVQTLLEVIKKLFPLRTCNLNLSQENIKKGNYRVCLEYQIKNCKGPCEGLQSSENYQNNIQDIKNILKGNISIVSKKIKEDIFALAKDLKFEEAHILKQKLDALENYESRSTVVSTSINNVDVVSIASDDKIAFVNYLRVVKGRIIQTQTIELKKKLDESDEELLIFAITEFRLRYQSTSDEIIVPINIELEDSIKITVPKLGDKKKLLELSEKNVLFFKKAKLEQYDSLNPEHRSERILALMQKDLQLSVPPKHIECFDNSNFQGSFPVSAMVVFKNAKPSKKDYRHFNVKTVDGPNDFATMKEVLFRRYSKAIEENQELPDLIIVDGGKGQLSSAVSVLKELNLFNKIPIIGIAKRLEEIFFPDDSIPLYLDKRSDTLKIIQQLRDEAHRFGITHHRNRRDKSTLTSELESISGIGKITTTNLLKHFKSIDKIKNATDLELSEILNLKQIKALRDYFS